MDGVAAFIVAACRRLWLSKFLTGSIAIPSRKLTIINEAMTAELYLNVFIRANDCGENIIIINELHFRNISTTHLVVACDAIGTPEHFEWLGAFEAFAINNDCALSTFYMIPEFPTEFIVTLAALTFDNTVTTSATIAKHGVSEANCFGVHRLPVLIDFAADVIHFVTGHKGIEFILNVTFEQSAKVFMGFFSKEVDAEENGEDG